MKLRNPTTGTPHAVHLTVLCGENRWWIEVSLWLDDGEMRVELPQDKWDGKSHDAWDLLGLYKETCERRDSPYDFEDVDPELEEPFHGYPPGHWQWEELPDANYTPEQIEKMKVFLRQQFPNMYETG